MPDNQSQTTATQKSKNHSSAWFLVLILLIISSAEGAALYFQNSKLLAQKEKTVICEQIKSASSAKPAADTAQIVVGPVATPNITPLPQQNSNSLAYEKLISLNKNLLVTISDTQGNAVGQANYVIKDYKLTKTVYLNGREAKAKDGRGILAFNVDITNQYQNGIQLTARDYIRLRKNNQDKWLSPDVHSDPVDIRPLTTSATIIGFILDENDIKIQLQIGHANDEKEVIDIQLPKK